MREIKFRAWEIGANKYFKFNEYSEKKFSVFDLCESEQGFFGDIITGNPSQYTIEQFTGLKDKNGVEIYEGDIVAKDHEFSVVEKGVIKYMECGFVVWFDSDPDEWYFLQEPQKRLYVIGNIHQNPELLK